MKEFFIFIKEAIIDIFCNCGLFSIFVIPMFLFVIVIGTPFVLLFVFFKWFNDWFIFKCKLLFHRYD